MVDPSTQNKIPPTTLPSCLSSNEAKIIVSNLARADLISTASPSTTDSFGMPSSEGSSAGAVYTNDHIDVKIVLEDEICGENEDVDDVISFNDDDLEEF